MADDAKIMSIERPSPKLLTLYVIRSLLSGPFVLVLLPYLYFRYHTLSYRFDGDGILMKWGFLFKREINLTYAKIQDIHVSSGIIQRWLGLADLRIQTASGNMEAEMSIEGIVEYEALRDFIYSKMRGLREITEGTPSPGQYAGEPGDEVVEILRQIKDEIAAARAAVEKFAAAHKQVQ